MPDGALKSRFEALLGAKEHEMHHQSTSHVRIVAGEVLDHRDIGRPKDEQSSIRRIAQCPRQQKFAALMRLSSEAQMFLPMRRPARHKIINHIVKQRVIVHLVSSYSESQAAIPRRRPE